MIPSSVSMTPGEKMKRFTVSLLNAQMSVNLYLKSPTESMLYLFRMDPFTAADVQSMKL